METNIQTDTPIYKYNIIDGISTIKGGVSVLKELGYPDNIIKSAMKILDYCCYNLYIDTYYKFLHMYFVHRHRVRLDKY